MKNHRLFEGSTNGDLLEEHGIKRDAWLESVRAVMEIGAHEGQAVLQVTVKKGLYPKDLIDDAFKVAPGGFQLC